MDRISQAIMGINESTASLVNSSRSLAYNVSELVKAISIRETVLIEMARRYPDESPETIRASLPPLAGLSDEVRQ